MHPELAEVTIHPSLATCSARGEERKAGSDGCREVKLCAKHVIRQCQGEVVEETWDTGAQEEYGAGPAELQALQDMAAKWYM